MNSFAELKLLTPWLKINLAGGVFKKSLTPEKDLWQADIEVAGRVRTVVMGASAIRMGLFVELGGEMAGDGGNSRGATGKDAAGGGHVRGETGEHAAVGGSRGPRMTKAFFEELEGRRLADVRMAPDDRVISMDFEGGMHLVFVLFGPGANVILMDALGHIRERFRRSARDPDPALLSWIWDMAPRPGAEAGVAEAGRAGAEAGAEAGDVAEAGNRIVRDLRDVRRVMLAADPRLPREHLNRMIEAHLPQGGAVDEIRSLARSIGGAILGRPEFRVLADGRSCLIPGDLLPDADAAADTFPDVNAMIRHAFRRQASEDRFISRKKSASERLTNLLKRRRHRMEQLGQEDLTLDRARLHEKTGHVILAHAHLDVPADGVLIVEDPFEPGTSMKITLDPARTMAENARIQYDKAEKARASIGIHRARRQDTEREIAQIGRALEELDKVHDSRGLRIWQSRYAGEIREPGPSMPYRELDVMGRRIWIGKSAQDNDEMLKRCHKEDLWLHARGVAGSHVVIRMEQKREEPPASLIERAASFAAWHSKSRGSSLVPVIVSRRKYVVKSKGSAPGAVRVLKERVVHVPPVEPPSAAEWESGR